MILRSTPRLLVGISVLWIPLAFLFDGVTVLMLPLRVGGDATQLGLVSFLGLAIAAGLQPVAGWASDRHRHRLDRRLFLAAAAVPAVIGLWILAGSTGLASVVVGYVLVQAGGTAVQAGQQTLIPEHVEAGTRGRASGVKVAFDVGGSFLAFLVLGSLLAGGDLTPAVVATTLILAAGLGIVLALVPGGRATRSPVRWSSQVPSGLASLILARFLFLFGTYAVGRFLVLLVAERLEVAPERAVDETGWLLALFTLATALAAIPCGWLADRRSRRDMMVAGAAVSAVGVVALAPSAGLLGISVGGMLMALGTAAFVTGNWAATTALVSPQDAGRLMAIANLGTGLAAATAGMLGPLIDTVGFVPALLVAAGMCAGSALPLLDRIPRARQARGNAT